MVESSLTGVTVKNATADHAIRLKYLLAQDGLIQGQDFSWTWHPRRWDSMTGDTPGFVEFVFQDPALATFYQLRWA
jgi:hypothetical protein